MERLLQSIGSIKKISGVEFLRLTGASVAIDLLSHGDFQQVGTAIGMPRKRVLQVESVKSPLATCEHRFFVCLYIYSINIPPIFSMLSARGGSQNKYSNKYNSILKQ